MIWAAVILIGWVIPIALDIRAFRRESHLFEGATWTRDDVLAVLVLWVLAPLAMLAGIYTLGAGYIERRRRHPKAKRWIVGNPFIDP